MRPMGNRVVVQMLDAKPLSTIIDTPETAKPIQGPRRGKVISVGKGLVALSGDRIPPDCEVGDVIIFRWHRDLTTKIVGEDGELWVVDEGDIQVVE